MKKDEKSQLNCIVGNVGSSVSELEDSKSGFLVLCRFDSEK